MIDALTPMIDIDPEAGIIRWKVGGGGGRVKPGDIAGTQHEGYIVIQKHISGKLYAFSAHVVIWTSVHGKPKGEIDHINGNKIDNRIVNLRDVTHAENCRGTRKNNRNSTSGQAGVAYHKRMKRWQAYIYKNYKRINLGTFATFEAACAARKNGEAKCWNN